MSDDLIPQVADTFKLMGDPSRLAILMLCLHGPVPVGEIALKLSLSPSLVSHHLRLLKGARLVRADRLGMFSVGKRGGSAEQDRGHCKKMGRPR